MQRELVHEDQHVDDDLDLDVLGGVAAFSKYHFHRLFASTFGLLVDRYVQLARIKRASYRLAYRDAQSVMDVAMDAAYDALCAFARALRAIAFVVPEVPDWERWFATFGPFDCARSKPMRRAFAADDVTVCDVPPTPATLGVTSHRFIV